MTGPVDCSHGLHDFHSLTVGLLHRQLYSWEHKRFRVLGSFGRRQFPSEKSTKFSLCRHAGMQPLTQENILLKCNTTQWRFDVDL